MHVCVWFGDYKNLLKSLATFTFSRIKMILCRVQNVIKCKSRKEIMKLLYSLSRWLFTFEWNQRKCQLKERCVRAGTSGDCLRNNGIEFTNCYHSIPETESELTFSHTFANWIVSQKPKKIANSTEAKNKRVLGATWICLDYSKR